MNKQILFLTIIIIILLLNVSCEKRSNDIFSDGIFYIVDSPESNRNILYKLSIEGEVLSKINLTGLFNNTDGYTFAMNKVHYNKRGN